MRTSISGSAFSRFLCCYGFWQSGFLGNERRRLARPCNLGSKHALRMQASCPLWRFAPGPLLWLFFGDGMLLLLARVREAGVWRLPRPTTRTTSGCTFIRPKRSSRTSTHTARSSFSTTPISSGLSFSESCSSSRFSFRAGTSFRGARSWNSASGSRSFRTILCPKRSRRTPSWAQGKSV